ncbi:MAG: hypothetical protein ACKO7W_20510 [Elainella sp.]
MGIVQESERRYLRLKRWIAILALLNVVLVMFNLTYLQLRSLYLQTVPAVVQLYDPVKGLYPHPETQRYLERVAELETQFAQADPPTALLAELRSYSQLLVQDNPFSDDAELETIRRHLQVRTGAESVFVAFDRFWDEDYLTQRGWQGELGFWNRQIRPLMAANSYRQVNRLGQPVDYFWLLDLPFVLLFGVDLAIRIWEARQRLPELSWSQVVLRRWYDLLLLLPGWRWLRLIPVTLRLQQVGLLDLELLQKEARRDFAIGFARDLIELVGVQAIAQIQAAVQRGDVTQWLLYPELRRDYVQVNDRNQIKAAVTRIGDIVIHQVLPQIQPDVELLISYNLQYLVDQLPGYRQLRHVPGAGRLPQQTTERLTKSLTKQLYQSLVQIWSDPELADLSAQLIQSFRDALSAELQKKQNTEEIEALLVEMLEEIKLNYVKGVTESEIEAMVNQTEQLSRKLKTEEAKLD